MKLLEILPLLQFLVLSPVAVAVDDCPHPHDAGAVDGEEPLLDFGDGPDLEELWQVEEDGDHHEAGHVKPKTISARPIRRLWREWGGQT